jgi:acetyl esterase/lipase
MRQARLIVSFLIVLVAMSSLSATEPTFTRELDIIYHKQDGFALTLDKVAPRENSNGAGILIILSGGWISNHDSLKPYDVAQLPGPFRLNATQLLERGFTLFYVVHGRQPKFTIREIHDQISAAVRHIRHHAEDYKIDPERLGIIGGSAGGHLSLLQGTKGESGEANPEQPDDESSKVQAVVAYFPPTDFVNYGQTGVFFDQVVREVIPDGGNPFLQALDYLEYDAASVRLTKVTDEKRLAEHYQNIAPMYHVTPDDAPALLLHGDADKLVPLQQSEIIAEKFKEVGVPHRLFIKEGGNHGWTPTDDEARMIADWFEQHLGK